MPVDYRSVEDAVRLALVRATEYDDALVIHENEDGNAPDEDYATFFLTGLVKLGQDAVTTSYDATRPAGEEIRVKVSGDREFGVRVSAFTEKTNAESSARSVLGKVQTRLALPSIRKILNDAGVSVFDFGDVNYVPQIGSTEFMGRGVLDLRCYLRDDASEYTGYIEKATAVDTDTGRVIVIDVQ